MRMDFKTKEIYVVWTNSDRTEGRGYEYPVAWSDSYTKAKSLANGQGVQGTNARIVKCEAFYINDIWYGPINIIKGTPGDLQLDEIFKKKEELMLKLKELGLTEEEFKLLGR